MFTNQDILNFIDPFERFRSTRMSQAPRPTGEAERSPETGESVCENIASPPLGHADSDAISPAVSPAISHAHNGRESLRTETQGKSCNQPGSESGEKPSRPLCYECKYRSGADFSTHSQCKHPIFEAVPGGQFFPLMWMLKGQKSPFEKRLNVTYNQHGFDSGWFMWPVNFDPVWLNTCDGFEQK